MAMPTLRRARPGDLEPLIELEADGFPPDRRESRSTLRRALSSPSQEVWLLGKDPPVGALWLRLHPRSLRIFSLAIRSSDRGKGYGGHLLNHACKRATATGRRRVRLEADASDPSLLHFYSKVGFTPVTRLPDYYGPGTSAVRMERLLPLPDPKPCL